MTDENLRIEQVVQRVNDSKGNHLGHMIHCPACNSFTSSDIKLTKNISNVDCNSCKRTIKYRQSVKAKCLVRNKYEIR
jgi:transcription elongation factor Elf1